MKGFFKTSHTLKPQFQQNTTGGITIHKFNTNYHRNSKNNAKKIEKLVEKMMAEDTNPQPFDFLFRYNTRNYPKTTHEELKLPGNFKKIEDTAVFALNNGVLQMDYAESVTPNGDMVKREAANNVEHLSGPLRPEKKEKMFDYNLYTTIQLKKPCYNILVTNQEYHKSCETYYIEGLPLTVHFRIFGEEKVYQLLNNLSEKDYSNREMSDAEFLQLIYCIIFAKRPYAKDVIERSAILFASIEKIKINHQMDLHMALKMTIKFHFRDEPEKIRELLTMITKAVHESRTDELGGYEVKQMTIEELKAMNSQQQAELTQKTEELTQKDTIINNYKTETAQQKARITELEKKLEALTTKK